MKFEPTFKSMVSTFLLTASLFAADLTSEDIRKAYYSSYELETQERYSEASKALEPVFRGYPQGYTVNYRRGWLAYLNGNYADAKKFYAMALTQYPSSLEVRKGIVLIDVARKEWKDVETQARTGRSVDYYNLDFAYWQAVALRHQGQNENAIKILAEMTSIYPTNTNFLLELVYNYKNIGKTDTAWATLEAILILDPYNPQATELVRVMSEEK